MHQGRLLTALGQARNAEFAHLTDTVWARYQAISIGSNAAAGTAPLGREELVTAASTGSNADAMTARWTEDASHLIVAALKTGCTDIWTLDRA